MELRIKGLFDRKMNPGDDSPALGIIKGNVAIVHYRAGKWQQLIIEGDRAFYRIIADEEDFQWFIVQQVILKEECV